MNVAIIGGGNIGTLMAADIASSGCDVVVRTSKPNLWSPTISVYDASDRLLRTARIGCATSSMEKALRGADYVFICEPAERFAALSAELYDNVIPGQKIGIVPGSGGAEFAFRFLAGKGCALFGLGRVHSIARLKEYGHSVYELGRKPEIKIASIPSSVVGSIADDVASMLGMTASTLGNYLAVTLTPSNSILHTSRLYAMFKDWVRSMTYPENFLFYEEWDNESSAVMLGMDDELQTLCRKIPLDLSGVRSLRVHYESRTVEEMTAKISGIKAFNGIRSPMRRIEGGWVPDFSSRYFSSDFPFGLKTIIDIARIFDVPTPNMDLVWNWYERVAPDAGGFSYVGGGWTQDGFAAIYKPGWVVG